MGRLCSIVLLLLLCPPSQAGTNDGEFMPASHYAGSLLNFINSYRVQHGLPSLMPSQQLAILAREHSAYMAERGDISHDGFEARFERSHRGTCVENVGWNYRDPFDQFKGWRSSSAHNSAMLNPHLTVSGIAIFDAYVTFFACS
jgi:uncharacterized protein YkwD